MKSKLIAPIILFLVLTMLSIPMTLAQPQPYPGGKPGKGFDQYGYNYKARIFNGLLGQLDRNVDGNPAKSYGSSTDYTPLDTNLDHKDDTLVSVPVAGTHLIMNADKNWDDAVFGPDGISYSGDELPWVVGAWCTNHMTLDGTATGTITWLDLSTTTINKQIFFKIEYAGSGGNFRWWGTAPDGTGIFNIIIQACA